MTRRRTPTARQIISALLAQGSIICCYRCRIAFTETSQVEREHVTPLALGGEDTPENWRFSHKQCHNLQTNGSRATSYGSDKHAIGKARRLEAKRLGTARPKRKRNWPKRAFPARNERMTEK